MKLKRKSALSALVVLIGGTLIIIAFLIGFRLGNSHSSLCPPFDINSSLFCEAYHTLQSKFVDRDKLDTQKMLYGAISGMVNSLDDPYTVFFDPKESKMFDQDMAGKFEGIGAEIGIRKGQLQIIAPLKGTPAQKAGILAGDKILKIDDKSTIDINIDEAAQLIRGPQGSYVTLTIFREGWQKPKEIKIKRGVIKIPSLKWKLESGNIAYVGLYGFNRETGDDFKQIAYQILNSPAKGIILDLRNNPGGLLDQTEDIAKWFLKRGQVIVIVKGRSDEKSTITTSDGKLSDYPLVILVNQGTASGAEILAAALRDNRKALLIGEKTFGKGLVQEEERLSGGSLLKVTIARWLTPKGVCINKKGIGPDVKIKMTEEDYKAKRDPQLKKAIEIMKKIS